MSFLEAFGLREDPFGVTPDPRFLYLGRTHREALASLVHGIEANRGFLALVAPPGMGKTTLLFRLLEHFRNSSETVFHFQTQCSSRELLRYLLADLGVEPAEGDVVALHQQFNQELLRMNRTGRRVVVVIDEAQNLGHEVLETIRLLSDFETPRAKLMQIILSGQEQLLGRLKAAKQSQLRQRISMVSRLRPLGPKATGQYIAHRMQVAGGEGDSPFTPEAVEAIAHYSGGIPRMINHYCFHGLSLAYALERPAVEAALIAEVAHDFELRESPESESEEDLISAPEFPLLPMRGASPAAAARRPQLQAPGIVEPELDEKIEREEPPQQQPVVPEVAAPAEEMPEAVSPPAQDPPAEEISEAATESVPMQVVEREVVAESIPGLEWEVGHGPLMYVGLPAVLVAVLIGWTAWPSLYGALPEAKAAVQTPAVVSQQSVAESPAQPLAAPTASAAPAPRLISRVEPQYPRRARELHVAGDVVLSATVEPDGKVGMVKILSGHPLLAQAAINAVRQWQYAPAQVDGSAVRSQARVTLRFP